MTRRRWLLLGGVVVLAWLAAATVLLLTAADQLREGKDAAEGARDGMTAESLAEGEPLPELRRARQRFASASSKVDNVLVGPLRFLPVLGRQLRSVSALAGAAAEVSEAAVEALTGVEEVLDQAGGGGPARLRQIERLHGIVRRASGRVAAVDDLGPRRALLGPLADARNELAEQLADARTTLADAVAGAEAGMRFLQGGRYLLVAANNAEMRAGSGMWLSGGLLTIDGGRLDLGEVEPLYDVADPPDGAAAITDPDLAARWGALWQPSFDWRGLMVSPRAPASAELGSRMWRAAGREAIDGILVVDPVALAAVVRATGPVEVDGRTVEADQVVPLLLHEQYLAFPDDSGAGAARREALGRIASAAFAALDAGEWKPEVLAGELADAVAGRHLLAWSADPVQQAGWAAAGVDGTLREDSLLVSVLNRGGNKLDWFLRADATIEASDADGGTDVAVRLRLRNVAPEGLPRYVAGPPPGRSWNPGRYVGVVAVNVPGAAQDLRIEGVARPVTIGADGPTKVVATQLLLERGQEAEVVVRFRLPGGRSRLLIEPSGRYPGITWRHGTKTWQDSQGRTANL